MENDTAASAIPSTTFVFAHSLQQSVVVGKSPTCTRG